MAIHLVNEGELELLTGLAFEVERWEGDRWVEAPWPKNLGFPSIGVPLAPGGATDPQEWPIDGVDIEPGRYRALKSSIYQGSGDIELGASVEFTVLRPPPGR